MGLVFKAQRSSLYPEIYQSLKFRRGSQNRNHFIKVKDSEGYASVVEKRNKLTAERNKIKLEEKRNKLTAESRKKEKEQEKVGRKTSGLGPCQLGPGGAEPGPPSHAAVQTNRNCNRTKRRSNKRRW